MGIFYILTVITLIISFLLIKKSDKKLNIINWLVLSFIIYLAYNIVVCLFFGMIGIHTDLLFLSILNILISSVLDIFTLKKIGKQEFYFRKRDILAVILIFCITLLIGIKQYHPFDGTVATASVDGPMHFSAATNFANNNIILPKIDNQTGYNFLTMQPGAYVNTGILMNVMRSVFGESAKDYKTFKCFEMAIFTLNTLAFYMLISSKLDTKYKFGIGCVFVVLFSLAYPYTSLLYGFSYLSLAMVFITTMFYLAEMYAEKEVKFLFQLILIVLTGIGIIFSYCLFVPAMFAFICINVWYYNREDKHKLFKKETMWVFATLMTLTIIGIAYLVIPTFIVSTQNKLTDAIGFEGGIYKGLFIDFIFYLPFIIMFIYKAIKEKKISPILIGTVIVGVQAVLTLLGLVVGIVSSYYYYKIYYIIYIIVVYIAVDVMCNFTQNKELQVFMISILTIFVGLILCVSVEFETRLQMKYPGLMDTVKSNQLVGIYYDTNVASVKNINVSCIVDANRVKLAEAMGEIEGITLKNMLVGGMNTNCKAWLYVISGIGCGGESINDLQKAVVETSVEDWLKEEEKEFFVLFTGDKYEATEEYDVVFQNEAGVILKKIY